MTNLLPRVGAHNIDFWDAVYILFAETSDKLWQQRLH